MPLDFDKLLYIKYIISKHKDKIIFINQEKTNSLNILLELLKNDEEFNSLYKNPDTYLPTLYFMYL